MRITNKMMSNNFLFDMQFNLGNLSKIQQQMASMKNFSKPSDDPFNVLRSMQLQTDINANTQYKANITTSLNFMNTTDTALDKIGKVISNIREKLNASGDAAYGSDERDKINDEVKQNVEQIAQLLNTSFDGEYIFSGTRGLSKPVKITTDGSIKYSDKDGAELVNQNLDPVQTSSIDLNNWKGNNITFTLDQEDPLEDISATVSIPADPTEEGAEPKINSVDDLVKNINDQIQSGALKDKVIAVKTDEGNIKFLTVNNSDDIEITDTSIDDLSSLTDKQFSSVEMDNISSKRKMEVSQGVVIEYNACATDILRYGTGAYNDTAALLDRIVHHLDGQVIDMESSVEEGTEGAVLGSDGNWHSWKKNEAAATRELITTDLSEIDESAKQLLKVRSEVGAKASRMESLADQNDDTKINMTDILSKTEDIDITQKTIEYYTMSTVYMACLQTGAKVMQPTLMDYIN
ncbi:flagellar hook-associated protein FlgL [Clostridium sp. LBM24168]